MRGGPWPSLLAAALTAASARAEPEQQVLRLSGACSYLNFLNGLLFKRQLNTTASGAPYYKATSSDYYIYYDPNCMGHSDGSARWIIDSDAPSLTRASDLDADGDCIFHALVSSGDMTRPPISAIWRMYCDSLWIDRVVTLEDVPQLDNPTSTRTTTTGLPATTTSTPPLPRMLRMEGACDFLSFLNTATFLLEGSTASGAPYWKSMDSSYYIYFDPDCHGGVNGAPRWIVDNDAPDTQRLQDLDNDGDCMYHAHTDSTNTARPPEHASWSMYCNHQWTTRQISFFEVTTTTTTSSTTTSTTTSTTSVSSTTTTTVSSTTSTTSTSTVSTTTTTTSRTSTSSTTSATSTATATTTGTSITSTSTRTATRTSTTTTAPPTTTATSDGSQGNSVVAPSSGVDDADDSASCDTFSCPLGMVARVNASDIACSGSVCGEQDNTTCCEEPSTTTVQPLLVMGTTSEAPAPVDVTTRVSATAEPLSQLLRLAGACPEKAVLEGAVFALQGKTASGSPFYKAEVVGKDYYIYYDAACSGVDQGKPRWILDSDAPSTSSAQDLDGDGQCLYFARLDHQDGSRLPSSATWRMHCGGAWKDVLLGLQAVTETTTPAVTPTSAPSRHDPLSALLLNGVCNYQEYLNGLVFIKEGVTLSGAPFYKAEGKDFYIYWDEHCDGRSESTARWIIDSHRPSTNRTVDLDGDGECRFLARVVTDDSSMPPLDGAWRVYCEHGWQDVRLDLQEAFARIANGTCEAAGKVTIVDSHACSMAGSYFNLSKGAPMSVPNSQGHAGCFWDAATSQLQMATSSHGDEGNGAAQGDAHGAAHGAAHGDAQGDAQGDAHGDAQGDAPSDAHGDAQGDAPGDAPGDAHGTHATEAAAQGDNHGAHRRLSASALEALCAGGHMAGSSHGGDAALVSAAPGLRSPAWALGVLALCLSGLAAVE